MDNNLDYKADFPAPEPFDAGRDEPLTPGLLSDSGKNFHSICDLRTSNEEGFKIEDTVDHDCESIKKDDPSNLSIN